jgi:Helix-turn-helix.
MGRKIEKLRTLVGLSQVQLGQRLGGISKQAVSKLEQSPKIADVKLSEVSGALGFTPEAVRCFTEETLVFFIENMHDKSSAYNYNFQCTYNPLDKVVELYERLLQLEREKVFILQKKLEEK